MSAKDDASVAVVGAGDYIGAAIARWFAAERFLVFAGRRRGDKLAPLVAAIERRAVASSAARSTPVTRMIWPPFCANAHSAAPPAVCIFNIGANVNFPLLETTERVFRKVWELACYAGFLAGREAARLMLPRGRGTIFFTGATASLRGNVGYAAFDSAAARLGVFSRYVDEMYRHMWSATKKLDDPVAWRAALRESGFNAEHFAALVQGPDIKAQLIDNTERSVARGTFGLPTFFVGNEIFFGKDRLRDVEEAILAPPWQCGAARR